jgi:hypothetical protein
VRPVYYERRIRPNFGLSGRWVFLLLLIALLAWLGYHAFLFGKSFLDARTASRVIQQAEAHFESGDKPAARILLKQAITLDPTHLQAARWMARMLDEEGSPLALEYHRIVIESGAVDAGDYRRLALSASRHGHADGALSAAITYRNLSGDAVFPYLIEARVYAANGNPTAQEKVLRVAVEEREDSETLGALAAFLLSDPEILDLNATEIARLLRRLAEIDQGASGLQALRTGLASGILTEDDLITWLALYRSHPAANPSSRVDAARIEIQKNPSNAPAIIEYLVGTLSNEPVAGRIEAARWLLEQGSPAAVQSLLPLDLARSQREPLELWIDSATALGQWDRIESALKNPTPSLPESARLPLLARAVKSQGRESEAASLHAEALQRFKSDAAAFGEVLRYQLAAGEWELFEKNLPVLINDPQFGPDALQKLVPVARSHRDSNRMLALFEKMIRSPFLAQNPFVLDRLQFNRLILEKPVAIEDIEFRLQQSEGTSSFRVTTALGLLKIGRKAKALYVLEGGSNPIDPAALPVFEAAVYAAVLAANGRSDKAKEIAAQIPENKLTRQEVEFLQKALAD